MLAVEAVPTDLLSLLPQRFRRWVETLSSERLGSLEEVRFRLGRPVAVYGHDWWGFVGPDGLAGPGAVPPVVTSADLDLLIDTLGARSLYSREHELAQGYLTLPGGHRAGIAGRAVLTDGRVSTVSDWCGVNVRVARAVKGVALTVVRAVVTGPGRYPSVLLIGPPRSGKTTVLRDGVRLLSDAGARTVVVDTRSEIGGGSGAAAHDLGTHTDVLDRWPRVEGLEAAIRALGPDLVAVDEIGGADDARAIRRARRSGVGIWATAHAENWEDVAAHPVLGELVGQRTFDAVVQLVRKDRPGQVAEIWRGGAP